MSFSCSSCNSSSLVWFLVFNKAISFSTRMISLLFDEIGLSFSIISPFSFLEALLFFAGKICSILTFCIFRSLPMSFCSWSLRALRLDIRTLADSLCISFSLCVMLFLWACFLSLSYNFFCEGVLDFISLRFSRVNVSAFVLSSFVSVSLASILGTGSILCEDLVCPSFSASNWRAILINCNLSLGTTVWKCVPV